MFVIANVDVKWKWNSTSNFFFLRENDKNLNIFLRHFMAQSSWKVT